MSKGTHDYTEDPRNADIQISINGEYFTRADAKISVFDSGFILGDGVWEGLRLHNNVLLFIDQQMGIAFCEEMLAWPPGIRESDCVWARHWCHEVEKSTGFTPFIEPHIDISDQLMEIADTSRPSYLQLYEQRLRI